MRTAAEHPAGRSVETMGNSGKGHTLPLLRAGNTRFCANTCKLLGPVWGVCPFSNFSHFSGSILHSAWGGPVRDDGKCHVVSAAQCPIIFGGHRTHHTHGLQRQLLHTDTRTREKRDGRDMIESDDRNRSEKRCVSSSSSTKHGLLVVK